MFVTVKKWWRGGTICNISFTYRRETRLRKIVMGFVEQKSMGKEWNKEVLYIQRLINRSKLTV